MGDENSHMSRNWGNRLEILFSATWRLEVIEPTGRIEICMFGFQRILSKSLKNEPALNISEKNGKIFEFPIRPP
jgi:hypothetical protein